MKKKLPKIIFFQIKKANDKLINITKTAALHFENKKHLLFLAPDEISQKYVDELLWKEPKFSFLPHSVSDSSSDDYIVISTNKVNVNNAFHVFNLTSEPFIHFDCNLIYEFDDQTDKKRSLIAKTKFKFYKDLGCIIESR